MKIGIASDHRGISQKKELIEFLEEYEIIDFGPNTDESVDYPIYAFKVGEAVRDNLIDFGIILCGSGIGMSIACNKVKKVRCAKVDNVEDAKITRIDNDSNVIALSSKKDMEELKSIVWTFINEPFSNEERHARRIEMISEYER